MMERSGNLYGPAVLQGNWVEDREQRTIGTNDGLRAVDKDFAKSAELAATRKFEAEISVPEGTGETADTIATCTRYRRHPAPSTTRTMADYGVPAADRFVTTSHQMNHHTNLSYVREDIHSRSMVTASTFASAIKARATALPEAGYGAVVPRHDKNHEQRHWETTAKAAYAAPKRENEERAGFKYEASVTSDPVPFPGELGDVKDQWGQTRGDKEGTFGEHHIRTATRMFVDYRGQDPPRLGITSPDDGEGPPLPLESTKAAPERVDFGRHISAGFGGRDNHRLPGVRIWQDE
eukprot:CAMPEP_0175907488 /NCGR_PEP_ID=MMETSP0108-20121206/6091_1 /TAXON_ID=195067 ORGANISM="Goniomonas pacifica, Strain CCMP1869" /NCGR_SAMPLE_ID=MMETSP0108 /ASSEMBLY_ACC=CAM_ASM_000204 /LENGTH=292 /DNA_ID=CAMNT_0017229479 /DNA_START=11 /DNA_END=889 /DNA_ORIENTATION=+